MNKSRQREHLKNVLKLHKDHPTAAIIYEEMRRTDPRISLGTVYRNLNLLSEMGEILRIDDGGSSARFDGCIEPHYHHVCKRCGAVHDLDVEIQRGIDRWIQGYTNHKICSHQTIFSGICEACLAEED